MSNTEQSKQNCILCRGAEADQELGVVQVWEDNYWRMTTSLDAEVLGFSYLEPKRHIPHITDLDGEEARTFGEVLAHVTTALREETSAELVYVYVFGGGVPTCIFTSHHIVREMPLTHRSLKGSSGRRSWRAE